MKIDAHQHFWRIDRFDTSWMEPGGRFDRIRRDFLPRDLEPLLRAAGIDRTVFVQTQHVAADNDWVLGLAERHDFIAGVVGWIDPTCASFEDDLLRYRQNPKFVGVRHLTHNEPDDDFILRGDVLRSLAVLQEHDVPFDLLFFVRHLRHAKTLAERLPGLRMVIDHLAKPHIADARLDDWLPDFAAAAACRNVYCKLSGMVTEADLDGWQPADLRPYVQAALDHFGADRCMFGSDWPVCELAASYGHVHDALSEALGPIDEADRAKVFGGTAAAYYGIAAPPAAPPAASTA